MKADQSRAKFVVCIRSNGTDDLEPRKVYQVLTDRSAAHEGLLRVVDESGEDYLYPVEYFAPVGLPVAVARGLVSTASRSSGAAARRARR